MLVKTRLYSLNVRGFATFVIAMKLFWHEMLKQLCRIADVHSLDFVREQVLYEIIQD